MAERHSACAHCGLPLRTPAAEPGFCCGGCQVAHALALRDPTGRTDRWLARVVLSALLSMGVMVFSLSLYGVYLDPAASADPDPAAAALTGLFRLGALALTLPILLLIGGPLLDATVRGRRWLSADALVVVSSAAAFAVSVWHTLAGGGEVYFETAALVLTLFGLGRWLETRARERASATLRSLLPERARTVRVVDGAGERDLPPASVVPGDLTRFVAGDVVAVDGQVERGRSFLDTAALTGEELPRSVGPGDRVLAGSLVVDGALLVRTEHAAGQRLLDGIERALAEALASRPRQVELADRLAAALLPAALVVAALTAGLCWGTRGPAGALLSALSVVLIACPCALGIATPLAYWTAIERAWRRGVLVRGGAVLESLAGAHTVLFDKTGTLTEGELRLVDLVPLPLPPDDSGPPAATPADERLDAAELLRVAASLERGSAHPVARAIVAAAAQASGVGPLSEPDLVRVLPGRGLAGRVDGASWALVAAQGRDAGGAEDGAATRVHLERRGRRVAELRLVARPRREAPGVLAALAARGLELGVLTGDAEGPARALERELGVPVEAGLSPLDKLERLRARGPRTVFVGDGLNDAAALAAAGVGVSMAAGSAATLEAADVNLLREGLDELPFAIDAARAAHLTARLALGWAVVYNVAGIALAAAGRLTPVFAAAAMVLSSAAVVLQTRRLAARLGPGEARAHHEQGERAAGSTGSETDARPAAPVQSPLASVLEEGLA